MSAESDFWEVVRGAPPSFAINDLCLSPGTVRRVDAVKGIRQMTSPELGRKLTPPTIFHINGPKSVGRGPASSDWLRHVNDLTERGYRMRMEFDAEGGGVKLIAEVDLFCQRGADNV